LDIVSSLVSTETLRFAEMSQKTKFLDPRYVLDLNEGYDARFNKFLIAYKLDQDKSEQETKQSNESDAL
jgi:hypothetical protein